MVGRYVYIYFSHFNVPQLDSTGLLSMQQQLGILSYGLDYVGGDEEVHDKRKREAYAPLSTTVHP